KENSLFIGFLIYAFSPFPSNQLFISYGLTTMPLRKLVIPFFFGRLLSYSLLTFSVNRISEHFTRASLGHIFGTYFIIVQILTIGTLYIFTKIDWHKVFTRKKVDLL